MVSNFRRNRKKSGCLKMCITGTEHPVSYMGSPWDWTVSPTTPQEPVQGVPPLSIMSFAPYYFLQWVSGHFSICWVLCHYFHVSSLHVYVIMKFGLQVWQPIIPVWGPWFGPMFLPCPGRQRSAKTELNPGLPLSSNLPPLCKLHALNGMRWYKVFCVQIWEWVL